MNITCADWYSRSHVSLSIFQSPLKSSASQSGSVNLISLRGHGAPTGFGRCRIVPAVMKVMWKSLSSKVSFSKQLSAKFLGGHEHSY